MPVAQSTLDGVLVTAILQGPPPATVADSSRWSEQRGEDNPEQYIEPQKRHWIRDRLWMIRDHLKGEAADKLAEYVKELGEPENPTFSIWHSEAYRVRDVSPVSPQDLKRMMPEELRAYVESFEPPADARSGPERTSHRGLAEQVASVILEAPGRYLHQLIPIARHRPQYAIALLEGLEKAEPAPPDLWKISLRLCTGLLEDDVVRTTTKRQPHGKWSWARSRVVDLLQTGFDKTDRAMPLEYLPRARALLLILLNDPDPDMESDRPPEGFAGHMDPVAVAINTVRPKVLIALLDYARYRANRSAEQGEVDRRARLEPEIREAFSHKLDREQDPSRAVHSVYGLHLLLLYWLDPEWLESNLDRIFPQGGDEATRWFFAAAWDAFVTYNPFPTHLFSLLRDKYRHAITCLSRGIATQGINQPQKHLAMHLVLGYLLADHEPTFENGESELLVAFFSCSPDARSHGTWSLWQAVEDNEDELDRFWPRVKALWGWRVREASRAGHSADFYEEMEWLAKLPILAPESETMSILWPLLEGLLPYVSRPSDRNMGWEHMEHYLAREVERDPVKAIEYYLLMHKQGRRPTWHLQVKQARQIIETAAADENARQDAMELIDLLGRSGNYEYRDIYERYAA